MFYGSHDPGTGLQYRRIPFPFQQLHSADEIRLRFNFMGMQRSLKRPAGRKRTGRELRGRVEDSNPIYTFSQFDTVLQPRLVWL